MADPTLEELLLGEQGKGIKILRRSQGKDPLLTSYYVAGVVPAAGRARWIDVSEGLPTPQKRDIIVAALSK